MKNVTFAALAFVLALGLCAGPALADHDEEMMPKEGFRADLLKDMANVEKKVLALAEAVPADKYSWAPTPEVRNVAASYIHMAQSNHQILQALGTEAPEGVGDMEQKITDKDAVIKALGYSFDAVTHTVMGMSDEDLETKVAFFGREWTKRQVLMLVAGHCHEHLGQAIAYARSVGTVPPWSQPADSGDSDSSEEGR